MEVQTGPNLAQIMNIPQINITNALARFDNDEETYLVLIKAFTAHSIKHVQAIKDFMNDLNAGSQDNDFVAFRIAAHSLKGSNRSIGADDLGSMAEKLESAARQGNVEYIAANALPFAEEEEKLIDDLGAFINTLPKMAQPEKQVKKAPDPALINALIIAAKKYDMAELKNAIEAIDAYSYESMPELAQWLREKAGKSDFEAITARF